MSLPTVVILMPQGAADKLGFMKEMGYAAVAVHARLLLLVALLCALLLLMLTPLLLGQVARMARLQP